MDKVKWLVATFILALMGGLLLYVLTKPDNDAEKQVDLPTTKTKQTGSTQTPIIKDIPMKLSSTDFEQGGSIPVQFTCDGDDLNPALSISDVPNEAKSLALIMEDPDVPKDARADGMWDHWIIFNISPDVTEIAQGNEPPGVHGQGTGGNTNYHGPCPPSGEHRYFFKLYALDERLALPEGSSKLEVEQAMEGHILDQVELVGLYSR